MYTPGYYRKTDIAEIRDFIRHNGFGILISHGSGKLLATHIPMHLSEDGEKLSGHVSKANPQWKDFASSKEVLAVFNGPHAYISSSWYDHENVPTWNYIAAHVYGAINIIEGEALYNSLKKLVDKYEAHSEKPISMETMSQSYIEKSIHGVVGFEIAITSMEATYKLSQNRDRKNYEEVIHQLEKRGDSASLAIAEEMKKNAHTIKK